MAPIRLLPADFKEILGIDILEIFLLIDRNIPRIKSQEGLASQAAQM